jgi:hypothetical protein
LQENKLNNLFVFRGSLFEIYLPLKNIKTLMMKKFPVILVAAIFIMASCSNTKKVVNSPWQNNSSVSTGDQNGLSYETAVFITEKTESKGVSAEYQWLRIHYPDYKFNGQSLSFNKDIPYDIIDIITSTGEKKSIYFDISNFYGHF